MTYLLPLITSTLGRSTYHPLAIWTCFVLYLPDLWFANGVFFLTFVEAFFTVYNGDSLTGQTWGSVQLTVVLVEFPVRSAYRFVVRLAVLQTLALCLPRCMVHHTVLPQTTVLMLTGVREAVMTKQACRDEKKKKGFLCENLSTFSWKENNSTY